jgi:hypothetical protein
MISKKNRAKIVLIALFIAIGSPVSAKIDHESHACEVCGHSDNQFYEDEDHSDIDVKKIVKRQDRYILDISGVFFGKKNKANNRDSDDYKDFSDDSSDDNFSDDNFSDDDFSYDRGRKFYRSDGSSGEDEEDNSSDSYLDASESEEQFVDNEDGNSDESFSRSSITGGNRGRSSITGGNRDRSSITGRNRGRNSGGTRKVGRYNNFPYVTDDADSAIQEDYEKERNNVPSFSGRQFDEEFLSLDRQAGEEDASNKSDSMNDGNKQPIYGENEIGASEDGEPIKDSSEETPENSESNESAESFGSDNLSDNFSEISPSQSDYDFQEFKDGSSEKELGEEGEGMEDRDWVKLLEDRDSVPHKIAVTASERGRDKELKQLMEDGYITQEDINNKKSGMAKGHCSKCGNLGYLRELKDRSGEYTVYYCRQCAIDCKSGKLARISNFETIDTDNSNALVNDAKNMLKNVPAGNILGDLIENKLLNQDSASDSEISTGNIQSTFPQSGSSGFPISSVLGSGENGQTAGTVSGVYGGQEMVLNALGQLVPIASLAGTAAPNGYVRNPDGSMSPAASREQGLAAGEAADAAASNALGNSAVNSQIGTGSSNSLNGTSQNNTIAGSVANGAEMVLNALGQLVPIASLAGTAAPNGYIRNPDGSMSPASSREQGLAAGGGESAAAAASNASGNSANGTAGSNSTASAINPTNTTNAVAGSSAVGSAASTVSNTVANAANKTTDTLNKVNNSANSAINQATTTAGNIANSLGGIINSVGKIATTVTDAGTAIHEKALKQRENSSASNDTSSTSSSSSGKKRKNR